MTHQAAIVVHMEQTQQSLIGHLIKTSKIVDQLVDVNLGQQESSTMQLQSL